MHPSESIKNQEKIRKIFNEEKLENLSITKLSSNEAIFNSDITLGEFSTALLESLLIGNPTILYESKNYNGPIDVKKISLILKAKDKFDLVKKINNVKSLDFIENDFDSKRKKFIEDFFNYKNSPVLRIIELLNKPLS